MGLDLFEMVMEIEDVFDIKYPDEGYFSTVGELVSIVADRLGLRSIPCCPSARAFHVLRREVLEFFPALRRRDVRPKTQIDGVLSMAQQRQLLAHLKKVGYSTQVLEWERFRDDRTSWTVLFVISFGSVALGIFVGHPLPFIGIAVAVIVACTMEWLRTRPSTYLRGRDFGSVALAIAHQHAPMSAFDQTRLNDVRNRIHTIVAEQLGFEIDEISDTSHFVKDLGC